MAKSHGQWPGPLAMALAMERIAGRLHLADADTLELSNLNRIPGSLFELGESKLISAARAIAEVDPYLEVEVWPGGFVPEVMSDFLGGLDLECPLSVCSPELC